MGLGTVKKGGLYLSIAGGFIWNRKADSSDPNYATQTYVKATKEEGIRSGARYADLTGRVVGVQFRTHQEYGKSVNVTFDSDGKRYIISISTNNRYSQDMMKALLKADLSKDIFMKPYDFKGSDGKRAMGISFRQNGEKINLRVDSAPSKEKDWFKTASKKEIKRFFEDLSDWYEAEVEEKVIPTMDAMPPQQESKPGLGTATETETETETEEKVEEKAPAASSEKPKVTPLKMKRALKDYIAENYEDKELPKLSKEALVTWYNLSLEGEELPFDEQEGAATAEVSQGDLDKQLEALMPTNN